MSFEQVYQEETIHLSKDEHLLQALHEELDDLSHYILGTWLEGRMRNKASKLVVDMSVNDFTISLDKIMYWEMIIFVLTLFFQFIAFNFMLLKLFVVPYDARCCSGSVHISLVSIK